VRKSPLHGFTAEFSQHRPYRAGDDLKYLDWKVLARTDRLYTRQFHETTNMAVMLVLDASASMGFPPDDRAGPGGVSKLRYAKVLAASLAYLIVTQGDAVGLITSVNGRLRYVPAKGGRSHLRLILGELHRLEAGGTWDPREVIARGAELLSRRGVVVAISDFYDAEEDTRRELRRAARRGHDVAMMQVVSRAELEFPYDGDLDVEDLETGARQLVTAESVRATYRSSIADFLERCRTLARRDGVDYALWPTDETPERGLRTYLLRRQSAAGV